MPYIQLYLILFTVAPIPRSPLSSEKKARTILPNGDVSEKTQLPCWKDEFTKEKMAAMRNSTPKKKIPISKADVFISVVVPAYNEEDRLGEMLEEAVTYLEEEYGDAHANGKSAIKGANGANGTSNRKPSIPENSPKGWEILVISDGSTDKTTTTALDFARSHQLAAYPPAEHGPRTPQPEHSTHIPHGSIRVIELEQNRGKGGAVTHGLRHVRGEYAVFADADGASKFSDLGALVRECRKVQDSEGRGVAVGSRAHMVGTAAVVKVRVSHLTNTEIIC
jgi:dolichyl-phosphate beta-glucosyltransferase